MFRAYRGEIPEGWQALRPVLCQVPSAPRESGSRDTLAAVDQGYVRFQAGVLLCPAGADGRAALQEFAGDASQEAAFLDQDGQYLQAAPSRPAYAVLLLEAPILNLSTPYSGQSKPMERAFRDMCDASRTGQSRRAEALVLLPLIEFPGEPGRAYPPMRLFVDGHEVEAS